MNQKKKKVVKMKKIRPRVVRWLAQVPLGASLDPLLGLGFIPEAPAGHGLSTDRQ